MEFSRVVLTSDHAGFELKKAIAELLVGMGLKVHDVGPKDASSVDYPDYASLLAREMIAKNSDAGIAICGSGLGMSICLNKFPGLRAVTAWNEESARLSRQHNNANVLCLGQRLISTNEALRIVEAWLATPFAFGRHQERVDKICKIEQDNMSTCLKS